MLHPILQYAHVGLGNIESVSNVAGVFDWLSLFQAPGLTGYVQYVRSIHIGGFRIHE